MNIVFLVLTKGNMFEAGCELQIQLRQSPQTFAEMGNVTTF